MAHTFTNLLTHIITSTKDRLPLIDEELKPQLLPYLGGIVRELDGNAYIINGTADHVHLPIGLPPTISISDVMRVVKQTHPVGFTSNGVLVRSLVGRPVTARSA